MPKAKTVGRVRQPKTSKKVSCLFHSQSECICIRPVTTNVDLISRLEHQIRLNELNAKFASQTEKTERAAAVAQLKKRLDEALRE
jgi:hypothetical protein